MAFYISGAPLSQANLHSRMFPESFQGARGIQVPVSINDTVTLKSFSLPHAGTL